MPDTKQSKFAAKKKRLILIIAVLLIVLIVVALPLFRKKKGEIPTALLTPVEKRSFERTINMNAAILPKRVQAVISPYNQKIKKLYVEEGDRVKQGDLIAVYDTQSLLNAYNDAKAAVKKAEKEEKEKKEKAEESKRELTNSLMSGFQGQFSQAFGDIQSQIADGINNAGLLEGLEDLKELKDAIKPSQISSILDGAEASVYSANAALHNMAVLIAQVGSSGITESTAGILKLTLEQAEELRAKIKLTESLLIEAGKIGIDDNLDEKAKIEHLKAEISDFYRNLDSLVNQTGIMLMQAEALSVEEENVEEKPAENRSTAGEKQEQAENQSRQEATTGQAASEATVTVETPPNESSGQTGQGENEETQTAEQGQSEQTKAGETLPAVSENQPNPENSENTQETRNTQKPSETPDPFNQQNLPIPQPAEPQIPELGNKNIVHKPNETRLQAVDFNAGEMSELYAAIDTSFGKKAGNIVPDPVCAQMLGPEMIPPELLEQFFLGGSSLESLKTKEREAKEALDNAPREIRAEFDGFIAELNVKEGEAAPEGKFELCVYDDSELVASANIGKRDAGRIKEGQKVYYDFEGLAAEGEIFYKSAIAKKSHSDLGMPMPPSSGSSLIPGLNLGAAASSVISGGEPGVLIKMSIKGDEVENVTIGFDIDSQIVIGAVEDVLSVPAECLIKDRGEYYVYIVNKDSIIERKSVKVGLMSERYAEIIEGLKENELIVYNTMSNIKVGEKVKTAMKKDE